MAAGRACRGVEARIVRRELPGRAESAHGTRIEMDLVDVGFEIGDPRCIEAELKVLRAEHELVCAGSPGEHVSAVEAPRDQRVVTSAADERCVAVTTAADQRIIAVAAIEVRMRGPAGKERVIASAAEQCPVVPATDERVVAGAGIERVIPAALAGVHDVVEIVTGEEVVALRLAVIDDEVFETRGQCPANIERPDRVDTACVAQHIVRVVYVKRIVAQPAVERVGVRLDASEPLLGPPLQAIVAIAANHDVGAGPTDE